MKLAAIDIGSNAARLLIQDAILSPKGKREFVKVALVRVPLRLGFDVFENGVISDDKAEKFVTTIKAYKHLLDVYEVKHLITAATSAMRDAKNAGTLVQRIKAETGVDIRVISGEEEATYIYENHFADTLNNMESYLYIDVGGGSTELTFFSDGRLVTQKSFNIGTIRLLKNQVTQEQWTEMRQFIRERLKGHHHITAIGTGGNINKVFSLSKRKDGKPLNLELLRNYYKEFSALTVQHRISTYGLREDRADVIVPALLIYINVMNWSDAEEIYVPKIGLADGLIHLLCDDLINAGIRV